MNFELKVGNEFVCKKEKVSNEQQIIFTRNAHISETMLTFI